MNLTFDDTIRRICRDIQIINNDEPSVINKQFNVTITSNDPTAIFMVSTATVSIIDEGKFKQPVVAGRGLALSQRATYYGHVIQTTMSLRGEVLVGCTSLPRIFWVADHQCCIDLCASFQFMMLLYEKGCFYV